MAVTQLNQKEYLKKYLSEVDKKKKKKKILKSHQPRIKIVDDDIDLNNLNTEEYIDFSHFGDEAPQVVAIVDHRPLTVKIHEELNGPKWKTIGEEFQVPKSDEGKKKKKNEHSPIRNRKVNDSDNSPPRKKNDVDSDNSPIRERTFPDSDNSPPRKIKDSDDDNSPPRKRKTDSDTSLRRKRNLKPSVNNRNEFSPQREKIKLDISGSQKYKKHDFDTSRQRQKKEYNSDASPPRRKRNHDSDSSPKRKKNYDSDASPPRRKRNHVSDSSPKRKKNYDSDASPPRRKRNHDSDSSPKRKKNYDSDASPPRRKRNHDSDSSPKRKKNYDSDASPPRRKRNHDSDTSPSRKYRNNRSPFRNNYSKFNSNSPLRRKPRYSPNNSRNRDSPRRTNKHFIPTTEKSYEHSIKTSNKIYFDKPERMEGRKTGAQLRRECEEIKRKEDELFENMNDDESGRNAAVVYRDRKTGRVRNFEEEAKARDEKEKKEIAHKEKYSRWGKGLKQVEDQEERINSVIKEMNKPFARYADDHDLEEHLKAQLRKEDPLFNYIKEKRQEKEKNDENSSNKQILRKPKYDGAYPANRFNIAPGYRWDGVDRSNGFEKKWFEQINAKKAMEEEAYKWSTADM